MIDHSAQPISCRGCPTTTFTDHPDPRVEECVRSHLDQIVHIVVHRIAPSAIIVAGSFGRGEGSAIIDGDQVKIISDYEVGIVTRKAWKRHQIVQLSDKLSEELGVEISLFWVTPSRLKHNRMKNLSWGKAQPTVFMFDLKAGSVQLYGNLDLRLNRLLPEDLPAWEGLRLLLNRLAEMLFQVDRVAYQQWIAGNSTGEDLPLAKSLLGCIDGLIVASGSYQSSARERFKIAVDSEVPHIDIVSIKDYLTNALDHRIRGADWCGIPWIKYREIAMSSLRILLEKTFHISFDLVEDIPRVFHPSPDHLAPVIQYQSRWLPISPLAHEIRIQKLKLKKSGLGGQLHRFRRKGYLPSLSIQSLIPGMVLMGQDHTPDAVLNEFRESTLGIDDMVARSGDVWDHWDGIRQFLKPLWKAVC